MTRIAIVGCGFVADHYMRQLQAFPELELVGVTDRDPERSASLAAHYSVKSYSSLSELLDKARVDVVLNLTSPESHYDVSRTCLEADKHVYSEKPLAMRLSDATALVELAEKKNLQLSSAPCTILGDAAQTVWKALLDNDIGRVRLAYAELDEGLVHRAPYKKWVSPRGIPWPYKNEFEVGCTLEHAGYYVSWLAAFFGPAHSVTAYANCLVPDKETDAPLSHNAPDFSVACIQFSSGVVARLTCSSVAPHDHSLRIIGDDGVLTVPDGWIYRSPVYLKRWLSFRRRLTLTPWRQKLRLVRRPGPRAYYLLGVVELAAAAKERRASYLSARFCLHCTEIVLAIHGATRSNRSVLTTDFVPLEPLPWAS